MESKKFSIELLIKIRDDLLERKVEPYIDEALRLLDPENTHNWNLMDDGDEKENYNPEPLEDWLVDRAIDNPEMFIN